MAFGSAAVVLLLASCLLGPEGGQQILILGEGSESTSTLRGHLGPWDRWLKMYCVAFWLDRHLYFSVSGYFM